MRHTSLATTTKYMRTVEERMRDAVENLGGDSMAAKGRETSDLVNLQNLNALAKILTNHGFFKGKVGGGGRSRTYDAADMSRVL
jgi:predicted TIM-barrel enzyme